MGNNLNSLSGIKLHIAMEINFISYCFYYFY
jgi:hypothetical protein